MFKSMISSVAVLTVTLSVNGASANQIVNGNFAAPVLTSDVPLGNDNGVLLPGWISTTSDNSLGYTQNYQYGSATSGFSDKVPVGASQAVLFNGDGFVTLTLSQTFATTLGATYQVNFDLSRQTDATDPNQIPFTAQVTGSPVQNFLTPAGAAANGYVPESFSFTATGSSTTLTFTSPAYNPGISSNSPELGNVFVTPEPSSLILCGLGAVGLLAAARRRGKA